MILKVNEKLNMLNYVQHKLVTLDPGEYEIEEIPHPFSASGFWYKLKDQTIGAGKRYIENSWQCMII